MRFLRHAFLGLLSLGMLGFIVGIAGVVYAISYYGKDLPDYSQLKTYEPPIVTRVYAGDGNLMAEFATEKRVFVPAEFIPDIVKQGFIAAEDKNFYTHHGVDFFAIARAAISNLKGESLSGASTITQQVAKNFLLSNERTYTRKIREAILSFRMERAMSKERLLELYLNEIYMGEGAYGVAAAALNYFNKSLEELQVHEIAFLAALPKAPNNYNPVRKHDEALERRNWVISRMQDDGYITAAQADLAEAMPLQVTRRNEGEVVDAPYFAEEVRRELMEKYGEKGLYKDGLAVRTSIDPRLQEIASRTLREGLAAYDKRHGYRGPLAHFDTLELWQKRLTDFQVPGMLDSWKKAVVLDAKYDKAIIGFEDGGRAEIELQYLSWARRDLRNATMGPAISSVRDVLKTGDVILAEHTEVDGKKVWGLRQIPRINGALVAMDPHTGRVLAMEGGWYYGGSEFNRATQAKRQPGSAFKPFVYLTALEKGFTPSTMVLDAPFVIDQGPGLPKWRPTNYSNEYYGPTPIRVGVEKSRNLMTVRLAEHIGMETIIQRAKDFGVITKMEPHLANCLGSGETTLLNLTTGYAQLVNGGRKITPTLIDRIQDRGGKTIFKHDGRPCESCGSLIEWENQDTPAVPDLREQIADPRHAYQMVSILEGVVERGTATRIKALGRPLAGKTGTTNDSKDTWFIGFSPDLVVGVFVGFDAPETMGKKETGASVAVPVFRDFMKEALDGVPPMPFRIPPGIKQVQVDAADGTRADADDSKVIWESFINGTEPTDKRYILDGRGISLMSGGGGSYDEGIVDSSANTGTGGLY